MKKMEKILESISQGIITESELFNFIEDFPALLWRIDVIQNKIEYLNSYQIPGLGPKSGLILQNIDFSRKIILKEDVHLLAQFMLAVRNGETAATIFRIKNSEGRFVWIKVTGTVNRKNPRYYLGYMLDVTDTVGIVQGILENHDVRPDNKTFQKTKPVAENNFKSENLARNTYVKKLMGRLKHQTDMPSILQTLLDNQYGHMNFDFIIYSDVYEKKNKVVVYTASKFLSSIKQGQVFSYDGTIAQNISRYKLDHLIVEDTFSSIKAIDWALFIPQGLGSYFAKPFFDRKVMRTVLVLCSTQKNIFFDKHIPDYELLYKPFRLGLTNWRKAGRRKK
jgi:hypothetical protein